MFKEALSKVRLKFQQYFNEFSSQITSIAVIANSEDESNESKKVFYFLSLILLISVILFSPDKIPQTFVPQQAEAGLSEKVHEIIRIIKRLMPNIG